MTWKELLRAFTALALCWAGIENLLQEGRLRQTAHTVFGLLSLTLWLTGIGNVISADMLPDGVNIAGLWQTSEALSMEEASFTAQAELALRQRGCRGEVTVRMDGVGEPAGASLVLESGDAAVAISVVAETLSLPEGAIERE